MPSHSLERLPSLPDGRSRRLPPRRARVLVVSPEPELAAAVRDTLSVRPLEVSVFGEVRELQAVPAATWRETLVALIDVDAPGAWDFIAAEERFGGVMFGVTLFVVSARPVSHDWEQDEGGDPPPWTAAFGKPILREVLLRAIDREIVFDDYGHVPRS